MWIDDGMMNFMLNIEEIENGREKKMFYLRKNEKMKKLTK